MRRYETFQVLLDEPADKPGMNFGDYAAAVAQVIVHSPPRFAVGVFGQWGCGKTTLMRAVEHDLQSDARVIPIWFNAWRYEREQHLIIPLLDVLRSALQDWTEQHRAEQVVADGKADRLMRLLGRSARALVAGLSLRAGVPGALEASWEATTAIAEWDAGRPAHAADGPQSVYHASFSALESAARDFLGNGTRRFVVFVDDLDRCLPEAALQVLESMKLFFDVLGFVFVVGLDRTVIERAVQLKYPVIGESPSGSYVSGTDYVKKIFQVQFNLPMLREEQLREFVHRLSATPGLSPEQQIDLTDVVVEHLVFLTGDGTVNPREVKRLINSYVLQMKTLERKLDHADPHVVLALQTMAFRREWAAVYEQLENDPSQVADQLVQAVQQGAARLGVAYLGATATGTHLPPTLISYLEGVGAPLLTADLTAYLSSIEATQSTDTRLREARRALASVRRAVGAEVVDAALLSTSLVPLRDVLTGYADHPAGSRALARLSALLDHASDPAVPLSSTDADADLDYLDAALQELRRGTSTGRSVA